MRNPEEFKPEEARKLSEQELKALNTADLEKLANRKNLDKAQLPRNAEAEKKFLEKRDGIWSKCKQAVSKTFDTLVVKPAKWVWEKVKKHPGKIALAVALFVLGYILTLPVPPSLDYLTAETNSILAQGAEKIGSYSSGLFASLQQAIVTR